MQPFDVSPSYLAHAVAADFALQDDRPLDTAATKLTPPSAVSREIPSESYETERNYSLIGI